MFRFIKCCRPLVCTKCSKSLRNLLPNQIENLNRLGCFGFSENHRICDSCRVNLLKKSILKNDDDPIVPNDNQINTEENEMEKVDQSNDSDDPNEYTVDENDLMLSGVKKINKGLPYINVSPISIRKITRSKNYAKRKYADIGASIRSNIFKLEEQPVNQSCCPEKREFHELISVLKQKIADSTSDSKIIEILTLLPPDWSYQKIQDEFNVSRHMIRCAKDLREKKVF